MIHLTEKSQCCGCTACASVCAYKAIIMNEDKEGFLYPKVDVTKCIGCGLCEKVCPMHNVASDRLPQKVFAAKSRNERIRNTSSSGGIFTVLAEQVINDGGVVFGARFNDKWEVVHSYTETMEGLAAFRGSKYVQSVIGNSFIQAETFLKQKRKVLFSGTPCQIAGLKRYLRKEYGNLLTVECACHGVPSPQIWREYLNEFKAKVGAEIIQEVKFREKSTGWKTYNVSFRYPNKQGAIQDYSTLYFEHPFMQAFLADYILRPSCYNCPAKAGRSGADITLADFWGIEKIFPEFDDDKGCSLVLDYSSRAEYEDECCSIPTSYDNAVKYNPAVLSPAAEPKNRAFFFHRMNCGKGLIGALNDTKNSGPFMRAYRLIYRMASK